MSHHESDAGLGDKIAGKAQEAWGRLTNDPSDVAKGKMKQAKGDVKERADEVGHEVFDDDRHDDDIAGEYDRTGSRPVI